MRIFGITVLVLLGLVMLSIIGFAVKSCSIARDHAYKSMENAVISYDEYQDIYGTCKQIDSDLGVLKATPDNDPQFSQFSKTQRINTMKQNMNRWVAEYNAKSEHVDKKWWKSSTLPQTLTVAQFSNY